MLQTVCQKLQFLKFSCERIFDILLRNLEMGKKFCQGISLRRYFILSHWYIEYLNLVETIAQPLPLLEMCVKLIRK